MSLLFPTPLEFSLAVLLDLLVGDPHWMPHPVRWIGRLVAALERRLNPGKDASRRAAVLAGAAVVLITVVLGTGLVWVLLAGTPLWAAAMLRVYFVYALLALRSLDRESRPVVLCLRRGRPEDARRQLARIVGRDTAALEEESILSATFETIAENLSDGVIAPLFFLALAGVPGMAAYKCINTLDSMLGHKNDRLRHFGTPAALLDDAANYLPARLTALFMLFVSPLAGLNPGQGWRIVARDARKPSSPNAGYPEAAAAGLLSIRLAGPASYFGVPVDRPYLGEELRPPRLGDYPALRLLLYLTSLLAYAAAVAALAL